MENYTRKPNTTCGTCATPIYRRPNELQRFTKVYCSRDCMWQDRGRAPVLKCHVCGSRVKATHKRRPRKFCSRKCSNKGRRGITYSKNSQGNKSQRRLAQIQNTLGTRECMVTGCDYDKVLEVHRHVPGRKGGGYVIGNMFAICPNHHAEITRGLLRVEKTSNKELQPTKEGAAEWTATGLESQGR